MTFRKTISSDIAQCSTSSHGAATDVLALSQSDVAVLAETFRLLGDQSRLKILLHCMRGSVAVGDIADSLDLFPICDVDVPCPSSPHTLIIVTENA